MKKTAAHKYPAQYQGTGLQDDDYDSEITRTEESQDERLKKSLVASDWSGPDRKAKKMTLGFDLNSAMTRLTKSENLTEITMLDKVLDWLAFPFAHETGMFFKGRRYYTI